MTPDLQQILSRIDDLYTQMLIGDSETLTLKQAAVVLGKSEKSVLNLYHAGKIGGFKPEKKGRGHVYFDKQELENYKRTNRVYSEREIESRAATYHFKKQSA